MYILDIFTNRRRFTAIFDPAWKVIGSSISATQATDGADQRLELFYFISLYYSTVYQAALSAGICNSSAHYLARMQTKKTKVDLPILGAAQDIFAAPDDGKLKEYASHLNACIQPVVAAAAKDNCAAGDPEFKEQLAELYQYFKQCAFSAEELFSAGN